MFHRSLFNVASASLLLCLLLLSSSAVSAQDITGTISGNVTDQSGAAVPGAAVTITNAETGAQVFTATTGDEGAYTASSLRPATYNVAIEAANFKRIEIANIVVQVDQSVRADAQLEAGGVEETVTISGEAFGQLERDTSSQDEVINTRQVQDLPLPSRNVLNLLTLVAGVSTGDVGRNGININQISVNGSRTANNEVTVDGASVINGVTGVATRLPSAESLREFSVKTSGYSAEYGRTAGGFVNAVVDSGTNLFRGRVYEFFRNEKLNANDFFNNLRGIERPIDRYNQFGLNLSGPVVLPRFGEGGPALTRNRDRTFFFFNYEGLRRLEPRSPQSTVPDERYRTGDFSQILAGADGIAGTADDGFLRDPLARAANGTPLPCGIVNNQRVRTGCFPGNRIPDSRIDPAARRILALIPLPNQPGNADANNQRRTNNFVNPASYAENFNQFTTRIDHNAFNGNTRVFGRYTYFDTDNFTTAAVLIPGPLDPGATGEAPTLLLDNQLALGLTQTITPTLVLEANASYVRINANRTPVSQGINVTEVLGIARPLAAVTPRINITGFQALGVGPNASSDEITNTFQYSANLSYVRGSNIAKFGFQLRKNQFNVVNRGGNFAGVFNFTGALTTPTSGGGPNAVYGFSDFLLGQVQTAAYSIPQPLVGRRNYNYGLFIQDDYKVTPRLTLNLGLRYEYEAPIVEVNDVFSRLDENTGELLVANQVNPRTGRFTDRALNLRPDRNNVAPRVGLAYSANDKTVVRAAFGVFYSFLFSNLGGVANSPGFSVNRNFPALVSNGFAVPQAFTLSQGIPVDIQQNLADPFAVEREAYARAAAGNFTNLLGAGAQLGGDQSIPYTLLYNVGVQRLLPSDIVIDISYVGSRGVHLPFSLPVNNIPFELGQAVGAANTPAATAQARPFSAVQGFTIRSNIGTSRYDSLQAKAERRFTRALAFNAAYTFSKSLDDASAIFGNTVPNGVETSQFPAQFRFLERGLSSFDRPHIFSLALQYTVGRANFLGERVGSFLNDFQINPIITARSGSPFTVTQGNQNPAANGARPSVINSNSLYAPQLVREGVGLRYLIAPSDPNFPLALSGPIFQGTGANRQVIIASSIGSLGRNTLREQEDINVDLSVSRRFRFSERYNLQLRAEAYNLFNRTNFQQPNSNLGILVSNTGAVTIDAPNFGLITSTNRPNRFLQLVARFDF